MTAASTLAELRALLTEPSVPLWLVGAIITVLLVWADFRYVKGRRDERKNNLNELIRTRPCLYQKEHACDDKETTR